MFAAEFVSGMSSGSASYYALVVRDDYTVGAESGCEIHFKADARSGIAPLHAKLRVMRRSQVKDEELSVMRETSQRREESLASTMANNGQSTTMHADGATLVEDDPLVLRLITLYDEVCAPSHLNGSSSSIASEPRNYTTHLSSYGDVPAGYSVIVGDGDEVKFGHHITLRFRYRPLIVSIEPDAFTPDYTQDLVYMFARLGATLCFTLSDGHAPLRFAEPVVKAQLDTTTEAVNDDGVDGANSAHDVVLHALSPIGLLHCVETLTDTRGCLVSLAAGWSIVQPTYVLEWFAALAQSATTHLGELPSPAYFNPPVRSGAHGGGGEASEGGSPDVSSIAADSAVVAEVDPTIVSYQRPELMSCPYTLYPIPDSAVLPKHSRSKLFGKRGFIFITEATWSKYAEVVRRCGGMAYQLLSGGDAAEKEREVGNIRDAFRAHASADPPANDEDPFFIVADDLQQVPTVPELQTVVEDAIQHGGRSAVPIIRSQELFASLARNQFQHNLLATLVGGGPASPLSTLVEPPASPIGFGVGADTDSATPPPSCDDAPQPSELAPTPTAASAAAATASADVVAPASPSVEAGLATTATAPPTLATTQRPRTASPPRAHAHAMDPNAEEAPLAYARRPSVDRRRTSLRPRTPDRTPTRYQLRYCGRRGSARLTEMEDGVVGEGAATSSCRGSELARRQASVAAASDPTTLGQRYDRLRLRLYAFLVREEPILETSSAGFRANNYLETSAVDHVLECRAEALAYLEEVEMMLQEVSIAPLMGGHGGRVLYRESLQRFWNDCDELQRSADELIGAWDARKRRSSVRRRPSVDAHQPRSGRASVATTAHSRPSIAPSMTVLAEELRWPSPSLCSPRPSVLQHRDSYVSIVRQQQMARRHSQSPTATPSAAEGAAASPDGEVAVMREEAALSSTPLRHPHSARLGPMSSFTQSTPGGADSSMVSPSPYPIVNHRRTATPTRAATSAALLLNRQSSPAVGGRPTPTRRPVVDQSAAAMRQDGVVPSTTVVSSHRVRQYRSDSPQVIRAPVRSYRPNGESGATRDAGAAQSRTLQPPRTVLTPSRSSSPASTFGHRHALSSPRPTAASLNAAASRRTPPRSSSATRSSGMYAL